MYVNTVFYLQFLLALVVPLLLCQPPPEEVDKHLFSASSGTLPYAVLIRSPSAVRCSGVILDNLWVLTAAHCVDQDVAELEILAGLTDYKQVEREHEVQKTYVHKIVLHEQYAEDKLSKYDLALIKVTKMFNFSLAVNKAAVFNDSWPQEGNKAIKCISYGFRGIEVGRTKENTQLKFWKSTAHHGEGTCPCTKRFQWKRLVCVRQPKGVNLCGGDVGSALICSHSDYSTDADGYLVPFQQPTVYGIAHMTIDKYMCQYVRTPETKCATIPTVGTYMYICLAIDWLAEHVPGMPATPHSCTGACLSTSTPTLFILTVMIYLCG